LVNSQRTVSSNELERYKIWLDVQHQDMVIGQQAAERHAQHAVVVTVATGAIAIMKTTHIRPGRTPREVVGAAEAAGVVEA
jgi:hypothetical protein